jgi:hypothetical protein
VMAVYIELTAAHLNPRHPDREALARWLRTMRVDLADVVVPSVVKVTRRGLTTMEELTDAQGHPVLREGTGEALLSPVWHEGDALPVPVLAQTRAWTRP